MNLIRNISNVYSFQIKGFEILFRALDKSLYYNTQLISENVSSFLMIDSFIFYTRNKVLNIYNVQDNSSEVKLFPFPSNEIQNGKFLNISNSELDLIDNNYSYLINTFSYPDGQKLTSSKKKYKIGYGVWKDPNFFFNTTEIEIVALHLPTETTLWQYSVAELGAEKVSKILGVFGDVLVVVCQMPVYPEHILIGLEINDGKLLWSVNLPQYLMHSNLFYCQQNNSIISLRRHFLWEFSLSYMEVIREKQLPETFKYNSLNVQVELASLYGDLIYFAGKDLENVRPSALVGVFDLKTEKLVDVYDLQSDGTFTVGGNSRPQVSGNKIYVLDSKNTLHILEREEDTPDLNLE